MHRPWISWVFLILGLLTAGFGVIMLAIRMVALRRWIRVEGEIVESAVLGPDGEKEYSTNITADRRALPEGFVHDHPMQPCQSSQSLSGRGLYREILHDPGHINVLRPGDRDDRMLRPVRDLSQAAGCHKDLAGEPSRVGRCQKYRNRSNVLGLPHSS